MRTTRLKSVAAALLLGLLMCTAAGMLTVNAASVKNGWSGSSYYRNGKKVTGLVKIGKKNYIFTNKGTVVKDRLVYRYKDKKGAFSFYNITKKGVATKWTKTAEKAANVVAGLDKYKNRIKTSNREKFLKKSFLWAAENIRYSNNEDTSLSGKAAAAYYGNAAFDDMSGECDTYAYAMYWMAKVLGYQPKYMRGDYMTGSGLTDYAWCQIPIDGKTYVFDPHFNRYKIGGVPVYKQFGKYWGYKFQYGDKNTFSYYNKNKVLLTK